MRRLSTTKQDHAGGSAKLASAASCPAVSRSLLTDPLFARPRVTLDKLAHQSAYQQAAAEKGEITATRRRTNLLLAGVVFDVDHHAHEFCTGHGGDVHQPNE